MDMHETDQTQMLIKTQSRVLKRQSFWRIRFDETSRWMQQETFWSMPAGKRLYIFQTEKIAGRRHVLFGLPVHNRPLMVHAEEVDHERRGTRI